MYLPYQLRFSGIRRGGMRSADHEVAGKITLKHVYEIAKIKSQDEVKRGESMKNTCELIVKQARRMGVEVVRELDAEEYAQFLDKRREIVKQQLQECADIKAAKVLRTG